MKSKLISRVFCHPKNSTDSICSCVAMSYLLNQMGVDSKPVCSSTPINQQTYSILSYFNVLPPAVVSDLYARAIDLKMEQPIYLKQNESVARALELYDIYKHKLMPVVDDSGICLGIVTFSSLFKSFLNSRDDCKLKTVYTSTQSIKYTLKSRLAYNTTNDLETYRIVTVSDDIEHFKQRTYHLTFYDFKTCIFICGYNIQINDYLLQKRAGCIILCKNTFEAQEVQQLAEETRIKAEIDKIDEKQYFSAQPYDTVVIFTDYSSTTATILAKQSTPVSYYLNSNSALLVNENAKVDDIIKILTRQYESGVCIVDGQRKLIGVISRSDILKQKLVSLTLVNFNDKHQALDGVFCDYLTVDRIVDTHALQQIQTDFPPEFYIREAGSTSTLVYQLFMENSIIPPVRYAGVLLGGILASTGNLLNSFTTVADQQAVDFLCQLTGIDQMRYGQEILYSGYYQVSIVQLFHNDISTFEMENFKIDCSSIELSSQIHVDEMLVARLESCMETQMVASGANICCVLVLDYYVQTSSNLLILHAQPRILGPLLAALPFRRRTGFDNVFEIGDLQSRRLQIFPMLREYLTRIEIPEPVEDATEEEVQTAAKAPGKTSAQSADGDTY